MTSSIEVLNADHPLTVSRRGRRSRLSRGADRLGTTVQRGMATAEYAVGILAAVALALVLLKIFTGAPFASEMLKLVLGILQKAGAQIK